MRNTSNFVHKTYCCVASVTLALLANLPIQAQSFGTKADYYFGLQPFSIALGDINGDGRLDVISANSSGKDVAVRLGQATGSIGSGSIGYSNYGTGGDSPYDVAVGDINNDGRLDIVTTNVGSTTCSVSVFTNTGLPPTTNSSAAFSRTTYPAARGTVGVALGDINGDGRLDIVIGSESSDIVSVMLGLLGGGFGTKTDYTTGSKPRSIVVRDINLDGKLDIIAANLGAASISVLLGITGGGFAPKVDYATGNGPSALALGDVNGDGWLDAVTSNAGAGASTVSVLLGATGGVFSSKTDYPTNRFPTSVALGDVNNDSRLDIVATNPVENNISVFIGAAGGIFGTKTDYTTGRYPQDVALGDINNDGRLDLFSANATDNMVSVLLNQSPLATAQSTDFDPISIYPNPNSGRFTIKLGNEPGADRFVTVMNGLGQIVIRHKFTGNEFDFSIPLLVPGSYVIYIQLPNRVYTKRITVAN